MTHSHTFIDALEIFPTVKFRYLRGLHIALSFPGLFHAPEHATVKNRCSPIQRETRVILA